MSPTFHQTPVDPLSNDSDRSAKPQQGEPDVEPSTESQTDIAHRVQQGLQDANSHRARVPDAPGGPAAPDFPGEPTFDGNPNPDADDAGGVFAPADDTPAVLRRREGAREP